MLRKRIKDNWCSRITNHSFTGAGGGVKWIGEWSEEQSGYEMKLTFPTFSQLTLRLSRSSASKKKHWAYCRVRQKKDLLFVELTCTRECVLGRDFCEATCLLNSCSCIWTPFSSPCLMHWIIPSTSTSMLPARTNTNHSPNWSYTTIIERLLMRAGACGVAL